MISGYEEFFLYGKLSIQMYYFWRQENSTYNAKYRLLRQMILYDTNKVSCLGFRRFDLCAQMIQCSDDLFLEINPSTGIIWEIHQKISHSCTRRNSMRSMNGDLVQHCKSFVKSVNKASQIHHSAHFVTSFVRTNSYKNER